MPINHQPINHRPINHQLANSHIDFPFEAVLWDMDGTLIDSEPLWIEEERRLMESLGIEWTDEDARYCLGGPMVRVDEYMRQRSGQDFQPGVLWSRLLEMVEARFSGPLPFAPGALELLEELERIGTPLALVSASPRNLIDQAMNSFGKDRFNVIVSNNDVRMPKPDPEGYLLAAERLQVDIRRTLIIEDSIPGIGAAQAAGAFVLGIAHFSELPESPRTIQRLSLKGLSVSALGELFNPILTR